MPDETQFKVWVHVSGVPIGELTLPTECLLGRQSPEGLEVYVIIVGAPHRPMAAGTMRLAFDHGFPNESESEP